MKPFEEYFHVYPRIVPADRESVIRIIPRYPQAKLPLDLKDVTVSLLAVDGIQEDGTYYTGTSAIGSYPVEGDSTRAIRSVRLEDGALLVRAYFSDEQEYSLTLDLQALPAGADSWNKDRTQVKKGLRFNLYSLKPDLMKLFPFKGNLHIHSVYSDGYDAPEYTAARFREEGFDFIALTDHFKHYPSLRLIQYWRKLKNSFRIFPGEEVHVPDAQVHIVNFGGSVSANEKAMADEKKYRAEVMAYAKRIPPEDVAPGQDLFPVAATEWVIDAIHSGGGVAIFCHPYWQMAKYMISRAVSDAVFKRRKFDVFEVFGGFVKSAARANTCQAARYFHEAASGNRFPVCGSDDSHGADRDEGSFGCQYTIVFARSDSFDDLKAALLGGNSVAVQQFYGETPFVCGDFRLVKYATFLLESYFPAHREICKPEGQLMKEIVEGVPGAQEALKLLGDRTSLYRGRSFGDWDR